MGLVGLECNLRFRFLCKDLRFRHPLDFPFSPDRLALPLTSMGLKRGSWIFRQSHLFHDGVKVGVASSPDRIGSLPNLNDIAPGHTVGVLIDDKNALHLIIDGEDLGEMIELEKRIDGDRET